VTCVPSLVTQEVNPKAGNGTQNFGFMLLPNIAGQLGVLSSCQPGNYNLGTFTPNGGSLQLTSNFQYRSYPANSIPALIYGIAGASAIIPVPFASSMRVDGKAGKFLGTMRSTTGSKITTITGPAGSYVRQAGGYPVAIPAQATDVLYLTANTTSTNDGAATSTLVFTATFVLSTGATANVVSSAGAFNYGGGTTTQFSINRFVAPANTIGLVAVTGVYAITGVGVGTLAFSTLSVDLATTVTTYNAGSPFGDFSFTPSPLLAGLLASSQSSATYTPTAAAILGTNTSAINYLSGDSVTCVLPPGDPGEFVGMDPGVIETLMYARSAYFGTGFYACADMVTRARLEGLNLNVPDTCIFDTPTIVSLAELPNPTAGAYSMRVMSAVNFDVCTEQQALRPVNTPSDVHLLDALTHLFLPDNLVSSNPNHVVKVRLRGDNAMKKFLRNVLSQSVGVYRRQAPNARLVFTPARASRLVPKRFIGPLKQGQRRARSDALAEDMADDVMEDAFDDLMGDE